MSKNIKNYKGFKKVNEQDEDTPFRLYGEGNTPQAELIEDLKGLIEEITRANPETKEDFEAIKLRIKSKKEEIVNHPNFEEFKNQGFEWQDSDIKLADWQDELKAAVDILIGKVQKKGLA